LRGRTLEGHLYREGNGVSQDYKEAVRWYRLAAEQGDASKLTTGFSSSKVALQP
jgi:TPR repeat protein